MAAHLVHELPQGRHLGGSAVAGLQQLPKHLHAEVLVDGVARGGSNRVPAARLPTPPTKQ